MSSEPKPVRLGDVCRIKQGRYVAPSEMKESASGSHTVPVVGGNGVLGFVDRGTHDFGVPLVTCRGSRCGLMQWAEPPTWVSNNAMAVYFENDHGDNYFLYHYLRTQNFDDVTTGTAQPQITVSSLSQKTVLLPASPSQKAIGRLMRLFEKKIQSNRRTAELLEGLASSIFRSWFIDFDPVKAKMAGDAPVGMEAETAELFPDSMEDSEIGEIPSGWVVQPLDSIAEYVNGLAMQKFPVVDDADVLPVIKIAQLRAGHTQGADFASGSLDPRYVVQDGDILFSWSGTLEVEYWTGGRGALNQHLFKVSGNTVPDWFAYFATRSFLGEFRAIASSKATTMGHIQRRHLTEACLPVPSSDLLEQASEVIGPMISLRIKLLTQNKILAKLRDSLLPRLISGELEIPDEILAA